MNHLDLKDYFQNVLGLQAIYPAASLGTEAHQELLIFVENLPTYTKVEADLLMKVLASIGIEPDQMSLISDPARRQDCKISFLDSPSEGETEVSSPRAMNLDPSLKKRAWVKLQKISIT